MEVHLPFDDGSTVQGLIFEIVVVRNPQEIAFSFFQFSGNCVKLCSAFGWKPEYWLFKLPNIIISHKSPV